MRRWDNIHKSTIMIEHINRMNHKNQVILSIGTEKASEKIEHLFIIYNKHSKMDIKETYLDIIKMIDSFSSKVRNNQGCPLSPLLFNTVLEILARAIRQETELKGIQIRKEVKLSLLVGDHIFSKL